MSDRAILLISVFFLLASLATAVWLVATGQVVYLDGLFLLLCCLTLALAFAIYIASLIKRAMEELKPAAPPAAKPAPKAAAEKPAPVAAE